MRWVLAFVLTPPTSMWAIMMIWYDDFKRGRKCFFSIHVIFNHKELQVVSTNKCISSKFPFLGHLESKLWQFHWNINSNFSKLTFKCKSASNTWVDYTYSQGPSIWCWCSQSVTDFLLPSIALPDYFQAGARRYNGDDEESFN